MADRMFALTSDENKQASAWLKKQDDAYALAHNQDEPYFGAIGGEVTYEFTPTSLGIITKVRHANGKVLDLTEYESWWSYVSPRSYRKGE